MLIVGGKRTGMTGRPEACTSRAAGPPEKKKGRTEVRPLHHVVPAVSRAASWPSSLVASQPSSPSQPLLPRRRCWCRDGGWRFNNLARHLALRLDDLAGEVVIDGRRFAHVRDVGLLEQLFATRPQQVADAVAHGRGA